ncbi:MAG TPA: PQQ-binding-like beta-propeller repeat protein, partial [Planctomycetota bacterium]|nr:PQQ-binding-like beta-propeller repeat protein [Planctomycetota bacterium]
QRRLARFGAASAELLVETGLGFEAAGMYESANDVYALLLRRFPMRTVVGPDGASAPSESFVAARRAAGPFQAAFAERPASASLGAQTAWSEQGGDEGVRLVTPAGRRPPSADAAILVLAEDELRALALDDGRRLWRRAASALPTSPRWRDGMLVGVFGEELAALDAGSGAERWRRPLEGARAIALEAAHGKAYLVVHVPAGRGLVLRAYDLASGDLLREQRLIAGPGGDAVAGEASLSAGPLHLMVRHPGDRCSVLDGFTGAEVMPPSTLRATPFLPVLTPDGLIVTAAAASSQKNRELKLSARRPGETQELWTWRAERVVSVNAHAAPAPGVLLLTLDREAAPDRREREIALIDLARGASLLSKRLAPGEFIQGAKLVDGRLLLNMRKSSGSLFVRAFDVDKDELRWESVASAGRNPRLTTFPAGAYVVTRFSAEPLGGSARGPAHRQDVVRLLDVRTGKVVDEFPIEASSGVFDGADTEVREGRLVLETASGVEVRR